MTIYSEDQNSLVKKLIRARKEARLNQMEVANFLGKTQSYVSKIESGQRKIDVIELKILAKIYKKDINFFL